MKNFVSALMGGLLTLVCLSSLQAQCVADSGFTVPGIYPTLLPEAPGCEFYESVITFVIPRDTTTTLGGSEITVPFNFFRIDGLSGLPAGMEWECNLGPDCVYDVRPDNPNPDTLGCVRIFGTPEFPATYPLTFLVTANLPLLGDQEATFETELTVAPCQIEGDCYTFSLTSSCEPAILELTNQFPSLERPGFSYEWTVTGPQGVIEVSKLENPQPIPLDNAGTYTLTYEAELDTIGYVLTGALIREIDCSDLLDAADVYWKLFSPSDSLWVTTEDTPLTNQGNDLPIRVDFPGFVLDSGEWRFEVWDNDLLGDRRCTGTDEPGVTFTIPPAVEDSFTVKTDGLEVTFYLSHPVSMASCSNTFTLEALPEAPAMLAADTNICLGDSLELTFSSEDSVRWYRNGAFDETISGTNVILRDSGTYFVEVINRNTLCQATSAPFTLNTISIPQPEIVYIDSTGTLQVNNPQPEWAYAWYSTASPGEVVATEPTWVPERSAIYNVIATDTSSNCVSEFSEDISVILTNNRPSLELSQLTLFPNPNTGTFTLNAKSDRTQTLSLRVLDRLGREVLREGYQVYPGKWEQVVRLAEVPAGVYHVVVQDEVGQEVFLMVVQ